MKILRKKTSEGLYTVIFLCQFLVACGGGSVSGYGSTSNGGTQLGPFVIVSPDPVRSPIPGTLTIGAASKTGTSFTDIKIDNTTGSAQTNIPFTFGHVFKVGEVPKSGAASADSVTGEYGGANTLIPLQVEIKAKHPSDNTARHAIISGVFPTLAANTAATISLYTSAPLADTTTVNVEINIIFNLISVTVLTLGKTQSSHNMVMKVILVLLAGP